jgi:hypothetical protein
MVLLEWFGGHLITRPNDARTRKRCEANTNKQLRLPWNSQTSELHALLFVVKKNDKTVRNLLEGGVLPRSNSRSKLVRHVEGHLSHYVAVHGVDHVAVILVRACERTVWFESVAPNGKTRMTRLNVVPSKWQGQETTNR